MKLKLYQESALETLSAFLKLVHDSVTRLGKAAEALKAAGVETELDDPLVAAWRQARDQGVAPASVPDWRPMVDGAGRQIPHVCLKLPTGGGKTFLAGHAISRVQLEYLKRPTGLILWIVPSQAIYAQTKAKLTDRGDPLRQTLNRVAGREIKFLEKLDGLTRADLDTQLCVMLLMLQATGRRDKETLKVFQDSGDYGSFFPEIDDIPANARLLEEVPNLHLNDLGSGGPVSIKRSMGNMLSIVRPLIVLDEGHKAYSDTARDTVRMLNPRFLIELSATPKVDHSNILVNISGQALKAEEMIKLPLELARFDKSDWRHILETAMAELDELQRLAEGFRSASGRYIRPILVVRVDRTGKDQRQSGFLHADEVYDHLLQRPGMSEAQVKRQTAEVKELQGDLLSELSQVRVVVTKDALREGWDCPFAYSLCVLSETTASTALTQMVGRVLRQPQAALTGVERLDRAYVYFQGEAMEGALQAIKKGLEEDGMGDLAVDLVIRGEKGEPPKRTLSERRKQWQGKRFLVPTVLHKDGEGWRSLDYERDVLSAVDWRALRYEAAATVNLADFDVATRTDTAVDFGSGRTFGLHEVEFTLTRKDGEARLDRVELVRLLLSVVPNPWIGLHIVDEALTTLRGRHDEAAIARSRLTLIEHIKAELRRKIDESAEAAFVAKYEAGEIAFKLVGPPLQDLNWALPERDQAMIAADSELPLRRRATGAPVERSLLEPILKGHLNSYEQDVALYLDEQESVSWWHRVEARRQWGLQGWRRHKVFPDFLVWQEGEGQEARLLALETKGGQFEGANETQWKQRLFALLEQAYAAGHDGSVVELGAFTPDTMRFRMLFQPADKGEAWKPGAAAALADAPLGDR
jgi:type III restriction enzyme